MKPKTLASLKRKLDALHSEWVRRKDAKGGLVACVTCGTVKRWQEQQCGHYISRVFLAVRFHSLNTSVQCPRCNIFLKGNYPAYGLHLVRKHGPDILETLDVLKHKPIKFSRSDYETMISDTKAKLAGLEEA